MKITLDISKIVTDKEGWDTSRADEAANCLRNLAQADGGNTWRAKVALRLAEQLEAQSIPEEWQYLD